MLGNSSIEAPDYYVAGRTIQPIEVIESWELCHHLGCIVKYIARYGRKGEGTKDLQKAGWYLKRELARLHDQTPCPSGALPGKPLDPKIIAKDWGLPAVLARALQGVLEARAGHFKEIALLKIQGSLRELLEN